MRVLSLASIMVAHARRLPAPLGRLVLLACLSFASACDKVPLLAPTGSVISLFPAANSVPVNGSIEIVVTVIENGVASTPTTTPTPTPTTGGTGTTGGTTPTDTTTTPTTTTTRAAA